ncbi:MAG: FAD binding domain-containing protein [Planctomycetota bacterium]|nr:FAD binding domain-containing protein [Planctomycetota bacterium]
MMRLPPFRYHAPDTAGEVAHVLANEGPEAMIVAGGTDLYPNMKRRHQMPSTLVSLRRVTDLAGIEWGSDGGVRIGAGQTLRALERDPGVEGALPALWTAVHQISTPVLRNMGTIGGNICLDTRCNYYNQNYEWRRAINFCMKCEGDVCWVAPSSPRCWAVNSSDTVPVLIALGARVTLVSDRGVRELPIAELFVDDGIEYLAKQKDEVLTSIEIPAQGEARSVYRKVRRRGAFDFPVAAVAVRLAFDGDRVESADIVLNAVGSTPVVCTDAAERLVGEVVTEDLAAEVAQVAWKPAKPLDNTDLTHMWRKKMVRVNVKRALLELAPGT